MSVATLALRHVNMRDERHVCVGCYNNCARWEGVAYVPNTAPKIDRPTLSAPHIDRPQIDRLQIQRSIRYKTTVTVAVVNKFYV